MRRRSVLGAAAGAAVLAGTAGCAGLRPGERRAARAFTPDERAVADATATAIRLRSAAGSLAAATPALAEGARRVATDHTEHLRALGAPAPVVAGTAGRPAPTPGGAPGDPVPPGAAGLARAEWTAAGAAARAAAAVTPSLAGLLGRVAASRAVHADVLAGSAGLVPFPPLVLGPETVDASATRPAAAGTAPAAGALPRTLDALLAGSPAAVFAYPLVISRVAGPRRDQARRDWTAHVAERDALERLLLRAGGRPAAAAPAYETGPAPQSPAEAAALAARVEAGLARLAASAVAGTSGEARRAAIAALVAAARRSARWSGSTDPLPGTPA